MMAESFNHFGQIAEVLPEVLGQVVRKTAFDGLANCQSVIRANGQIDTGFMINSGYVRTYDESTYGQGTASPSKGAYLTPEVERPPDKLTAYFGFGANYSYWQNYGTRFMAARPFLEPGIELTRPGFEEALSKIEDKLKEVAR